ncbi:MAG: glycosyltransferase family 39 protein [Candidatus Brocadiaceae bacterium]|uniref:ArnT family glycosyltransferase n=1 Tax=Candidatus Wunengus sp. YC61 TaxID=3367698 RepID=UPI002721964F|nr:glycosyltransferase family 39 protein [Candidatus Brocadiaceae bacterium]
MLKEIYLPRFRNKKAYYLFLLLLICFAVVFRAVYFNGFFGSDDIEYSKASFKLANGDFSLDSHHSKRLGLVLPTALAFKVFGFNEVSSVLFLLICSIANIVIAFIAGNIFFNKDVGLLASLLMLFLPIDSIYATLLTPDLPFVTFISASGILFIYTEKNVQRYKYSLSFLTGLCIGCAYLLKETALLVLLILCVWILILTINSKKFKTAWLFIGLGFMFILLSEFGFYYYKTGNPFERILTVNNATHNIARWLDLTYKGELYKRLIYAVPYLLLRGNYIFGFYFYLVLGGILYALLNKSKELKYFVCWFISLYLVLNFSSTSLKSYIPLLASHRHFYPLIFPGIMIISFYLYDSYKAIITHNIIKVKNFCISLIIIDFILICLNLFECTITDILFGSLLSISILYCIYIITNHEKEIDKTRFVIPVLLGTIFLHSLYVVRIENNNIQKLTRNERETVSILGTPLRKKIYTDYMTEGTLEYLYAYHYDKLIVDFMGANMQEVSDCYVIINPENVMQLNKFYGTEIPDFVKSPPDTWKIIKRFTTPKGGSYIIIQVG